MLILKVLFVLTAIAMIALILMQRGAGAQAGSGFGAGASSTVFGARGSANFLSKATKWLAVAFFGITLFMAWQASQSAQKPEVVSDDLGVMGQSVPKADQKATPVPKAPAVIAPQPAPTQLPAQPAPAQPTAPAPQLPQQTVPAQPAVNPTQSTPAQPTPQGG